MEEENQKLLGAPGTTEKKVIWDTPVQVRGTGPALACVLCLALPRRAAVSVLHSAHQTARLVCFFVGLFSLCVCLGTHIGYSGHSHRDTVGAPTGVL